MKQNYLPIIIAIFISFFFDSCLDIRIDERKSWKEIFERNNIEGGFEIFDNNREIANFYNKEEVSRRFPLGNTEDVFTALVGLEIPVILDENKKPSIFKQATIFGEDTMSLRTAFTTYDTAFMSKLKLGIGNKQMKWYLDTVKYGNMVWPKIADSMLMITPDEQVGLMKRLYFQKIPSFSQRVQNITLSMMKQHSSDSLTLYYRIAPFTYNDTNRVWVIGIAEGYNSLKNPTTDNIDKVIHPYFFALNYYRKDNQKISENEAVSIMNDLLKDYQIGSRK